MGQLTKEQDEIVLTIRMTAACLTIVGCLFIIISMIIFKKLRSMPSRLIFWLSCSSLITGCVNLLSPARDIEPICYMQGLIMQFSQQATFLWTCVIATNLFIVLVVRYKKVKLLEKWYHVFVWSYATGFALCPIFTHDYGIAGPWCWITDSFMGNVWRFACFYLPLFMYLIYVFVVYVIVAAVVRYTFSRISSKTPDQKKRDRRIINRLVAYPIIFFVLWVFPSINRIYGWASGGNEVFWLFILQSITAPSQGFCNALAYGLDSELRHRYKKLIMKKCCCCSTADMETGTSMETGADSRTEGGHRRRKHEISHRTNLMYLFECIVCCKGAHSKIYDPV